MKKSKLLFCIIISCIWSCVSENKEGEKVDFNNSENTKLVTFKGREIDLTPYVEGFPYGNFNPVYAAGKLYYLKSGTTSDLMELDLSGNPDLGRGKKISDIDYATRNVWETRFNENDKHLYWIGDETNDEIINLTCLNPETGKVKKLTDVPYIFGYRWNEAQDRVAFVARLGDKDKRLGELRMLDLITFEETKIIQDTPEMRYTWGSPSWQPEGKGVVITAVKNADRSFGNMVYIDFESRTQTVLTDQTKDRSYAEVYRDWLDNNTLLYISDEDGFRNVYLYDLKKKESKQLTKFTTDLGASKILTIEDEKYLFVTTSSPIETQIYLLSLPDGKIVLQQKSNVNIQVYDADGDKMLVAVTSNSSMFRIDEVKVSTEKLDFKAVVNLPQELKNKIYNATPERITFPTFDKDPATGKQRELHAYLYKPKSPLPENERIVMIESFYGGGNYFSKQFQILANAGIYILSPSPRGCYGFGKEFSDLNNKDLGGNEIIDIFYAAKYISEKLDIPPQNIGVFGASHGGYATMRALTFPSEVNGNKVEFDWGFGISHAGFSDIIHFYENCNIPDWVILEAGDPQTEAEKLNDRSPLYHADKMKGHLLLTHGTNDNRVPIAGSEMMADSLKKYSKDVKLVKFEGQGHGIKGMNNIIIFYQTWFDFLEEVSN